MKPPKIPEPPGAYGPTQYPFIGMNCSFWAVAAVAAPSSARPNRANLTAFIAILLKNALRSKTHQAFATSARLSMMNPVCGQHRRSRDNSFLLHCIISMGERPEPQFLLADLPQAREAVRLD